MKRSLTLGALMAFVITGSAMAASYVDNSANELTDETTIINATFDYEVSNGRYGAIGAKTTDVKIVADELTVSGTKVADRLYAIFNETGDVNKGLQIDANSINIGTEKDRIGGADAKEIRSVRSFKSGLMTINGDTNIYATNGKYELYGFDLRTSTNVINGNTFIDLKSNGRIFAINNVNASGAAGSETIFEGDVTIKTEASSGYGYSDNLGDHKNMHGIQNLASELVVKGDVNIVFTDSTETSLESNMIETLYNNDNDVKDTEMKIEGNTYLEYDSNGVGDETVLAIGVSGSSLVLGSEGKSTTTEIVAKKEYKTEINSVIVGVNVQDESDVSVLGSHSVTMDLLSNSTGAVYGIRTVEHSKGKKSGSLTFDTTDITVLNNGSGKAYGVYAEAGAEINLADTTITATSKGGEAYGIGAYDGSSVVVGSDGKTVSIAATSQSDKAAGVLADESTVTINGTSTITATSNGNASAYGVRANSGSEVTLGTANVTATSKEGNGFGFILKDKAKTENGKEYHNGASINVTGATTINVTGGNDSQGVYGEYSQVTFGDNVTINATGAKDYAYAVRMLGDRNTDTKIFDENNIEFNGETTILKAQSANKAFGLMISGCNNSGAEFNGGKVTIEADGDNLAYGLIAQYGANAVTSSVDSVVEIKSKSDNGTSYGIHSTLYAGDKAGTVNLNGNVTVNAEGNSAYGVDALNGSSVKLGSASKAVSITATGTGSDGEAIAVYVENANSEVNITAETLTVNATSKNTNQPGSSLQAKEGGVVNVVAGTANITGMMYAEGQGSRIDVTANTAANIKGDIFTKGNGVVVLTLKGEEASFTGATNIESAVVEENADATGPVLPNHADEGTTLVLENGATWYVTGNSTVNGIIGDKFNVKAAEGVTDAVVTIDGHLPDGIDDDYNKTESTITGVDLVINEDGDGLGGNVTLNSDSDITVNATERGIYAEKDTHVNIKAATLTLNNKEGYDAINANGEVNIDAANLVFNGKVVADGEDSVVNITTGDFAYDANKQFATENNGVINIAGENISGELKVIGGNVNLASGNVTSTLNIGKGSTVSLTGATIETKDLASIFSKYNEGKLVIDGTGVLKTTANQVFTVAEDTKANTGLKGNEVIDDKVTYKAGTVSLSDDYSYEYLSSINDAMKAYKYDGNNASTTKLVMTGKLVTKAEDIKPEESITIDQASNLGNNIELDNVTVEAEKNLLIGANVAEDGSVKVETSDGSHIEVEDSVENGFSANQLDLGEGSTGAVITGGQAIVLGGSQNDTSETAHEVVTVKGEAQEVTIVVGTEEKIGDAKETKGTLKIGNSAAKETDKYQLTGKAVINKDSELYAKGETTITKGVELKDGGKVHVEKGHHLNADIKAEGENNVIKGKVTSEKLEAKDKNTKIHLGDKEHAGKMHAKESKLNGGTLFLDPAYAKGVGEGSEFALENANALDGAYIAGQNSTISFGVAGTNVAEEVFAKTGLTFGNDGDVDAVVYIDGTTDVTNGSITADGALTSASSVANGTVAFAANSLLMVEAEDVKGNTAAITGANTVTIDDNAKLYIDDAVKGETYKIIAGKDNGWKAENILTNNQLIKFTDNNATDNKLDLVADVKTVNEVYGKDVIIDKVVDEALDSGADSSNNFNSAVDDKVNVDKAAQVDALNSIGAMNEVAGVTHTTYAVSNILTDAVADHMSLANGKDHDKDIWAHYVHTKENVDGLKRAGAYDAQYNGIVVGTDLYNEGKATVGAALTYVDGNINASSVAARTENDAKYYGASVYGSIQNDDTAVIADVSYLHGEHDITQRNSGKVITGEPESDAFSVGVRVEKEAKAGIGKLVPYAGLRYMHLGTGNYTNSIGLAYNADDAELFLLPVGLKYSADIKNTNGWTMRPVVEFGYVWAFGDTDADQTVSLNGASNGFGYDVTDSGSYVGRFMLEAEKANISYALGYEYQKGDNVEADKWMVNVNWKF